MRYWQLMLGLIAWIIIGCTKDSEREVTVFAASSTADLLGDLTQHYQGLDPVGFRLNFAGSSTLARQIQAGAGPDLFISANQQWMDYLGTRNLIQTNGVMTLMSNQLVLVASKETAQLLAGKPREQWPKIYAGRLAMGDPDHVPAGIYAKEALNHLDWWSLFQNRLVTTQDVRASLRLVLKGEVGLGIVYVTETRDSEIDVLFTFPHDSHQDILYPVALCRGASQEAAAFFTWLSSREAQTIIRAKGFSNPDSLRR